MARKPILPDLIATWAPRLQAAFLSAISEIRDQAQIGLIVTMLERGDIEGAIRAVGLDPVAFRTLDTVTAEAFNAGGGATVSGFPAVREPSGHRLAIRFDVRNPRAEAWLRDHSSQAITEIVADQQAMIREHLTAGMAAGENPRQTALNLIGRINPATRKREGGALGLTTSQAEWARRYEAELIAGDPAALSRKLRDRRFDGAVRKAAASGKPPTAEQIVKMVAAYKSRALRYRAEVIGRTEAMTSLHQAQDEATRQAIDAGQLRRGTVSKVWRSATDSRVRDTHHALNGTKVPFDASFVSPSGARLRFPGDPLAPASEIVQCRCTLEVKVDYLSGLL